ncbi:MAG: metal ABC transporter substrate-binding protein [Candidatus Methylomirabilales bacterium]
MKKPLFAARILLGGIGLWFLALLFCGFAFAARLKVVTTTTDLRAIAEAVGGDRVEAESLLRGYQDPHNVEIKPSYLLKLRRADLFIRVGLDLDPWADPLLDGARNGRILKGGPGYLDASAGIEVLEVPTSRVDRSLGDIHIFGNPHYWLDPENGKRSAAAILGALSRLAPQEAPVFQHNYAAFVKRLDEAMAKWQKQMEPYHGVKIVTYHKSWSYFARRFGLVVAGFIEPKPGVPPSPSDLVSLINRMKEEGIKLIVMEPYQSEAVPRRIAQETGARVVILPPSVGGERGVDEYIALFDRIIEKLTEAAASVGLKINRPEGAQRSRR